MTQQMITSNVGIQDWNENVVSVPMFQLLQWKYALQLECKGLKHSRGSVAAHVRKILSAPKSYKTAELAQYISDCVDNINAQLEEAGVIAPS